MLFSKHYMCVPDRPPRRMGRGVPSLGPDLLPTSLTRLSRGGSFVSLGFNWHPSTGSHRNEDTPVIENRKKRLDVKPGKLAF